MSKMLVLGWQGELIRSWCSDDEYICLKQEERWVDLADLFACFGLCWLEFLSDLKQIIYSRRATALNKILLIWTNFRELA